MKRKSIAIILALILVLSIFPLTASAAGVSVGASPSSVNVGDTVKVSVKFSCENIGAVQATFSYDSSVLSFVSGSGASNGKIALVASEEGKSSLSTTLTFKAVGAGSSKISVKANGYDFAENGFSASGSASVTVKGAAAPATPSPTPAKPTASVKPTSTVKPTKTAQPTKTARPTKTVQPTKTAAVSVSPSPTVDPKEGMATITVNGKTLYVSTALGATALPSGFTSKEVNIGGKAVEGAADASGVTLIYALDENLQNGAFYVLLADGTAQLYNVVTVASQYAILALPAGMTPPDGYVANTEELRFNDIAVQSWVRVDPKEEGMYLVYAINSKGLQGFYLYDSVEGTFQRFHETVITKEVVVTPSPTPVPTVTPEVEEPEQPSLVMIIALCVLGALIIALTTTLIVMSTRKKRTAADKKKQADEDARREAEQKRHEDSNE